jgi:hypothetical protein
MPAEPSECDRSSARRQRQRVQEDQGRRREVTVTARQGNLRVTRMSAISSNGRTSLMESHYLVGEGGHIDHFVELHEMGLFSRGQYVQSAMDAGLRAEWRDVGLIGRGLLIAQAPG